MTTAPSCPSVDRLAAAATGILDDEVIAHAAECTACRTHLDEQTAMRDLVAFAAPTALSPALSGARRAAIEAEVMARVEVAAVPLRRTSAAFEAPTATALTEPLTEPSADSIDAFASPVTMPARARRRSMRVAAIAIGTALAAGVVGLVAWQLVARSASEPTGAHTALHLPTEESIEPTTAVATVPVPPGDRTSTTPRRVPKRDLGTANPRSPRDLGTGRGSGDGSAAGSGDGSAAPDPTLSVGIDAFREGWTAMREGKYAEAAEAFDRAADPAVAEDALYWSAVAHERAGHIAVARRRFGDLVTRFPTSPRVVDAKAAVVRLSE